MKNMVLIFMVVFFILILSSCQLRQNDLHIEYVTPPCLIPTEDNRFKLCNNMIIRVHNKLHAVPTGFKTDLASIPRLMWTISAPSDYNSIAAAILHDWHYCCVAKVSRKRADEIFYYGLRVHGMNRIEAFMYYLSVRAFGWRYYLHGQGLPIHKDELIKEDLQGVYTDANYRLDKLPHKLG